MSLSDAVWDIGLIPIPLSVLISHPNSSFKNLLSFSTSPVEFSNSFPAYTSSVFSLNKVISTS